MAEGSIGTEPVDGIDIGDVATRDHAQRAPRFRPGFSWGLAAGALAVVLIVVVGFVTMQFVVMSRFARVSSGSPQTVVFSPVKAGQDWFSVKSDGTGTLKGWSAGSSGSDGNAGPAGTVAFFDVGELGSVNGVKVTHTVQVYVTPATEFVIGGQKYQKGISTSAADAIFNGDQAPGTDLLRDRLLTITFHRLGSTIVADRVSAPLETGQSPLNNY
jgi:hypothetical protein